MEGTLQTPRQSKLNREASNASSERQPLAEVQASGGQSPTHSEQARRAVPATPFLDSTAEEGSSGAAPKQGPSGPPVRRCVFSWQSGTLAHRTQSILEACAVSCIRASLAVRGAHPHGPQSGDGHIDSRTCIPSVRRGPCSTCVVSAFTMSPTSFIEDC